MQEADITPSQSRLGIPQKGIILLIITLFSIFICTSLGANAYSGDGQGIEGDAYIITSCAQLQEIDDTPENLDAFYQFSGPIECGNEIFNQITGVFTGSLDGMGFPINNLSISVATDGGGIFAETNGASIKNLSVNNATLSCSNNCGILVGNLVNTNVESIAMDGSITGSNNLGGAFGVVSSSTISKGVFDVNIIGGENVGGAIGLATSGTISDSYSLGEVQATDNAGGFVGKTGFTSYQRSYSASSVTSSLVSGGYVGLFTSGSLADIFTTSSIGGPTSGALIGQVLIDENYTTGNLYFDVTRTSTTDCVGDSGAEIIECTGVNATATQSDYFFNNTVNPPLDQFDFDTIWFWNLSTYPTLFSGDGNGDNPTTTTSTTSTTTTTTPNTGVRTTTFITAPEILDLTSTTIDPQLSKNAQAFSKTFNEEKVSTIEVRDKDTINVSYNGKDGPASIKVTIENVDGDKVEISYIFNGRKYEVELTLGTKIELDFDGDGESDVTALVKSTKDGKAEIEWVKLSKEQPEINSTSAMTWLLIAVAVLLVVGACAYVISKRKDRK